MGQLSSYERRAKIGAQILEAERIIAESESLQARLRQRGILKTSDFIELDRMANSCRSIRNRLAHMRPTAFDLENHERVFSHFLAKMEIIYNRTEQVHVESESLSDTLVLEDTEEKKQILRVESSATLADEEATFEFPSQCIAEVLVRAFVKRENRDDFLGSLLQDYSLESKRYGKRTAQWLYWKRVVCSVMPLFYGWIAKGAFLAKLWDWIRHYLS